MDLRSLLGKTIVADIFHAPTAGKIEHLPRAAITIDDGGKIASVSSTAPASAVTLPAGQFLVPGLVDLHMHAPQFPQLGTALDLPLEPWLQARTFPLEARFADAAFAADVYGDLVAHTLACGTTTALYYGTVHVAGTVALAATCVRAGQRAVVGKVAMDDARACPPWYRDESAAAAVAGTAAFIRAVRQLPGNAAGRVQPAVTPRFVPACTDACLRALGRLAAETGARVQTHASESDWEHEAVLQRTGVTDAAALDAFGLLREGTVLAHGTFLSEGDMRLVRERGAAVAHCAWSNAYFSDAVFPLRKALARGVRVGLGTDVSGGPISSVWDAGRMAMAAARMLESGVDPEKPAGERGTPGSRVGFETVFYLATRGGAVAAQIPVGAFQPGLHFDAVAVDPHAKAGQIYMRKGDSPMVVIEKTVHGATKANVAAVWTDGVQRV